MKQGSNQAMRFFVMETLKDAYRGGDQQKKVPKLVVGAFGAVAGENSNYEQIVFSFASNMFNILINTPK